MLCFIHLHYHYLSLTIDCCLCLLFDSKACLSTILMSLSYGPTKRRAALRRAVKNRPRRAALRRKMKPGKSLSFTAPRFLRAGRRGVRWGRTLIGNKSYVHFQNILFKIKHTKIISFKVRLTILKNLISGNIAFK